ncbi:MAG TPA: ATP-binding protein [Vicinamibacterales bacterium]|nr:ATP-binding protein [Vicinamibacterales bacterium]
MSVQTTAQTEAPEKRVASTGTRVFVIDDDEVMLLSCRRILAKDGYEIETFNSGAAGLARLEQLKPQLLLVDLKMPELDGIQVIGKIRELDPDLVIAVITGYATIETAVDAMKAGAYDFLPKPFTPDELRLVVTRGCERWQLADEARRLRQEKQRAERRIVTFVSHQLKSPLASAKQCLDVLVHTAGTTLTPSATEWVGRAQGRLQDMLALIDDWLTLAHAEQGTLGHRDANASLGDVIKPLVEASAAQAERASVRVKAEIPSSLPAVRGDALSLATVISNVLTNAIKYNRPGGSVVIRATDEGAAVRVEVTDTGIGIPEESLPQIFEEFYRVPGPERRDIGGTGLGLAICRRVLSDIGGSIDVASTPGAGSTFTIRVPRADRAKAPDTP